jgi:uncharacterized protein (DUF1778 family)
MKSTTNTSKQREDRGRTIRIRNEEWKCLDLIAKQRGMTRHGFVVNTIKKALAEATITKTNQS